jgi:hypothetical protein|tara:strand:- start:77 stop:979 length:903 start_codon:yes stop_codon:yes gene_type:complete
MSQAENKESQLEIIDKYTDNFLKTLLNIKVNDEENDESSSTEDDDEDGSYVLSEISDDSGVTDASKSIKSAISKIFPSFKEKDYKLIKQKVDKLSELIDKIKADNQNISKDDKENLKKEIKTLIITILQLNNESNIIDAYEPLFTKNLIVSNEVTDSKYNLDIQDNSEKVIGISGVLNKDFIGKLKYLDEIIQLKEKTKDNVENIIAEVGNTSIKELEDLLEKQNKEKEEARIKNENDKVEKKAVETAAKGVLGTSITQAVKNRVAANPTGGKRTFKRRRKTRINKKNKRKTNKSKQNKK